MDKLRRAEIRQESLWICVESRKQTEMSLERWGMEVSRSRMGQMSINEKEGGRMVQLQRIEVD